MVVISFFFVYPGNAKAKVWGRDKVSASFQRTSVLVILCAEDFVFRFMIDSGVWKPLAVRTAEATL